MQNSMPGIKDKVVLGARGMDRLEALARLASL
jgi:hypothetical protein